jgi:hypothetical protein
MCTLQDSISGPLMENWAFAAQLPVNYGRLPCSETLALACWFVAFVPPPVLQEIIWGIESLLLPPSPIPPVRAVKDQNISELSCSVRTCACLVYEGSAQMQCYAIFFWYKYKF